ncbi:MAG: VCBS repeat-containing protein, partial [Prosthecobacter sp.]|nr:VCBS repeat-containing protein [Prosthecobacter sp.]
DWNGDKKPDIAYVTEEKKLILHPQGEKPGDWTRKTEFVLDSVAPDTETLLAPDLNADGRTELALLTKTRLMIWQQTREGWAEPRSYVLGQSGCGGLRAADLDGDGRTDLLCTSPEGDAVFVRLQQDGGSFGEEWRLEMEKSRCWAHAVHLGKNTPAALATIHEKSGLIAIAKLSSGEVQPNADHAATLRYSMPATDAKGGPTAYGDLNGDGQPDVVLCESKNARLWFFAGVKGGAFREGREFPALSGIEALSITDVDGDSKPELVILSPGEKAVALSRWQKDRLTYPEVIHQSADSLLTLTTGTLADDKTPAIHALVDAKGKISLLSLRWDQAGKKFAPSSQELPSSTSGKPNALRVVDANQDGRGDLALFSTLSPMQLLISQGDAKAPFKRAEGLPDTLVNKLQPIALATADVDGDGKAELILAKDQFARAVRVGPDGKAVTVEQFNAPDPTSQISAVLVSGTGAQRRILLADSAQKKLHEMAPGADGVFRTAHSHTLSALSAEIMHLAGSRLLIIGKTSFDISPLEGKALRLDPIVSLETELKDTRPTDLIPAAFSGAGMDDLARMDSSRSRVLEFLQPAPAAEASAPAWRSAMYFRVFETDPHFRGKGGRENEPHDYTALDLNADGKLDLALLVHDRLLLYLRK